MIWRSAIAKIRPTAESGYKACQAATSQRVAEGNVGAGAGATIGKMFGPKQAMKSGLGSASIRVGSTGIVVGAIVAVNAVGDVVDPKTGKIIAGARKPDGSGFMDSMARIREGYSVRADAATNTTIGVVATNVALDKAASHQGGADGARWAGADHLSGAHAERWRHDFRGGDGRDAAAGESRGHRRVGRRGDGASGAAGGDECARDRRVTELLATCGHAANVAASYCNSVKPYNVSPAPTTTYWRPSSS